MRPDPGAGSRLGYHQWRKDFPVHVIELTDIAFGSEAALGLPEIKLDLLDQAQKYLDAFAAEYPGQTTEPSRLVYGDPRSEIQRAALELAAELIIAGSHGRHGVALLFGSTAKGMLHAG